VRFLLVEATRAVVAGVAVNALRMSMAASESTWQSIN
jgi:hypothetical protein